MQKPASASRRAKWSIHVPFRYALMIPSGSDNSSASAMPRMASSSVAGQRLEDQRRHGLVVQVRIAEVTPQRGEQPVQVLLPERPVESHRMAHGRDRLWISSFAQSGNSHVARDDVEDEEDNGRDQQQDRHHVHEPADDIAGHTTPASPLAMRAAVRAYTRAAVSMSSMRIRSSGSTFQSPGP